VTDGKIYLYVAGAEHLGRIHWNPHTGKLGVDENWKPKYLEPGQTVGTAPTLMKDWIIQNQNAQFGQVPQCVVAVSTNDASKSTRFCPWGNDLPEGVEASVNFGSFGTDPDNNLIFVQDPLVGGVYAVKIDPDSGEMKTHWHRPDWNSSDYFSLIGDKDERVLISQNIEGPPSLEDFLNANYNESVEWANANTGDSIASSASIPATAQGSLPNVGYGGRLYMMGNAGQLFIYQPKEETEAQFEAEQAAEASPDASPVADS
jgi:hypothetical protein